MAVRFESKAEPITGYRLIERLGSGGFGEVWKAEAPGGIFKAIKLIHGDLRNRETDAFRFAEQELKSLKRVQAVRHPYLLALDRYDIVDGRLMIVMELADCNLWDRFRECRRKGLPGIPRDELLQYMAESAEVLDLMNDQFQLQHLDIKPQNLFLLYNHVKVADFGQVKDLVGMVASVTGGITPVYAAPETFDGFVSRYCDQYSLACVYQELLTGDRPFDGTTMQQLLLQHLQMPPNLNPSPAADRPALTRALAKKAEDRFPTITAMVHALRTGMQQPVWAAVPGGSSLIEPSPQGGSVLREPPGGSALREPIPDPTTDLRAMAETSPPPRRQAPPEQTGPGSLRPAVVIGLGYTGQCVLARFRKLAADRFGPPERLPLVRALAVDTDPDAAAGLKPDDVFCARLQRAGHYLKPRLNGRTLLEGWFDPQLLYRLPRHPQTMGLRAFGRLAFCDYYRTLMQRLDAELDACLDPQALADAEAATGLEVRTNRPRVYVVAGLGGGTGSGMFVDVAYAVRDRLRRFGYDDPDVVGVLLVPPDGPAGAVAPQAQANTYAALTELYHFSRTETAYTASLDDRAATVRDPGPPFTQVVMLPGLPHPSGPPPGGSTVLSVRASGTVPVSQVARGMSGTVGRSSVIRNPGSVHRSGVWARDEGPAHPPAEPDATGPDPTAAAAEFLRLELFTPVGRLAEEARPPGEAPGVVRTFGVSRVGWPRAEVVARAARVVAPVLINHWVTPDPRQVREVIPNWAAEQWSRLGLDPARLTVRLADAADATAGARVEQVVAAATDPLTSKKGWLARTPEPERVQVVFDQLQRLLGRPAGPLRPFTPVEEAIKAAADRAAAEVLADLTALLPALIETPLFRLAGTEEATRQVLALVDRARLRFEQQAAELETQAGTAFDLLAAHAGYQRGGRKLTASEFADAIARYPSGQYKAVLAHGAIRAYRKVRDRLADLLTEVSGCRVRAEGCRPKLQAEADTPAAPAAPGELLPAGCATPEDAAQAFLRSLTDEDLVALDVRVQEELERSFGGLYQACLNSTEGLDGVLSLIREAARSYLDGRVGEADLGSMLARQYKTNGLAQALAGAAPDLVGGPWAKDEVAVLASPDGPARHAAAAAAPRTAVQADARDEVLLYREYPRVPLAAVPQLGPAWAAAYRAAPEDTQQATPHARTDITRWTDVDS
ncbi:MAG TPA: tubulin-like doman-containing protein [Fimbriiglobus sp.]|nr:tubulin-like doman-containing protein [Fimbriiglobus sp.]